MTAVPRYLFIFDGRESSSTPRNTVSHLMKELDKGVDYDFFEAGGPDDALRHVSLYCDLHKGIDTCFVSCGGDSLTSGVAAGLMGADDGKSLAIFRPEEGHSLAACYEGRDFGSAEKLLSGTPVSIDMIRVNNTYALNACTFGLDSLPGLTPDGKPAGLLSSLSAVLHRSFRSVRILADGAPLDTGSVLFFTVSNGMYAPGHILCAPQAANNDGLMDLCVVRNLPPARMMKLVPAFVAGKLEEDTAFSGDFFTRRVKKLEIESSKDAGLSLDGRAFLGKHFTISIVHNAVRFMLPAE